MKAPITDKQLLELMWERFPEIMGRGVEHPAQQEPLTDEHIERIYHRYGGDMINCARAIERAAQRTWVGLTDEEIDSLREANSTGRGAGWRFNFKGFARAIEAKLKERNT